METAFHLRCSPEAPRNSGVVHSLVERLTDMLCTECGESCQGFYLADDFQHYQDHNGPKVGWVIQDGVIFLRMANCPRVSQIKEISEILKLFSVVVVEARQIH